MSALHALCAIALVALPGCASEYHPEYHPVSVSTVSQNLSYPVNVYEGNAQPPAPSQPTLSGAKAARNDPSKVLILQSNHLDRASEVVGVVDAHESMGTQEQALNALRTKAAAMGADAVVGVEFHHGESEGEPTHLSGLAVRFIEHGY